MIVVVLMMEEVVVVVVVEEEEEDTKEGAEEKKKKKMIQFSSHCAMIAQGLLGQQLAWGSYDLISKLGEIKVGVLCSRVLRMRNSLESNRSY